MLLSIFSQLSDFKGRNKEKKIFYFTYFNDCSKLHSYKIHLMQKHLTHNSINTENCVPEIPICIIFTVGNKKSFLFSLMPTMRNRHCLVFTKPYELWHNLKRQFPVNML